ncbi:MAG: putative DCC family thiol-disulfide oxidoreductase YuxK [Verrucomicrobiales bacterium]|jgi:predicted DCC family thiol-disulfide oxidoreductase YuxK
MECPLEEAGGCSQPDEKMKIQTETEAKRDAPVKALAVFFDQDCNLCGACRRWLMAQDKYIPLEFMAYQSRRAREICPRLAELNPDKEIVVMADNGQIYQGGSAWIMCLYALRKYRELSMKLAHPMLLPLAKKMCHVVSSRRMSLSRMFRSSREELARELIEAEAEGATKCENGGCEL